MKLGIYSIIILFFLSCSKDSNNNPLIGKWNYSKRLFMEEQEALESPKADLSDIFKTIQMVFNDSEFTSYLDDQITKGQWKIENDSLCMFLDDHGWKKYAYKNINGNLIIYDRDFIIALEKSK